MAGDWNFSLLGLGKAKIVRTNGLIMAQCGTLVSFNRRGRTVNGAMYIRAKAQVDVCRYEDRAGMRRIGKMGPTKKQSYSIDEMV